jgi:hypothetical protein
MNTATQSESDRQEPAQGTIDTEIRYRDRPSDDGKNNDAAAQPRPNAALEDAAGN